MGTFWKHLFGGCPATMPALSGTTPDVFALAGLPACATTSGSLALASCGTSTLAFGRTGMGSAYARRTGRRR